MIKPSHALLLASLALSPALAQAEVLTHAGAKVQITVPDKWTQKQDGDVLLITSPDKGVALVFSVMPSADMDAVFAELDKKLTQQMGDISWENDGEPTEDEINGMPYAEWNGSAKEGSVYVDVIAVDTPADKDLGIYWFTAAEAEEANKAAIATIVKGLKPAK